MGMEFLTSPWHHLFFGEDTAKYQESHTKDALFFIPYGVIVDYFQELVYTNPDWTPDERNAAWLELEQMHTGQLVSCLVQVRSLADAHEHHW